MSCDHCDGCAPEGRYDRGMRFSCLLGFLAITSGCGGRVSVDDEVAWGEAPPVADSNGLNDRCGRALPVELGNGGVIIMGDTSVGTDEHAELTCESPNVAFTFDQPQLYYRLELHAHQRYRMRLTPTFYGFVYAFAERVGCSFGAIEAACSSHGALGDVSPIANPNTETALELEPPQTEAYLVGVDGDTSPGPFTLHVTEVAD